MLMIKTKNGYAPIVVPNISLLPNFREPERYSGPLPSLECKRFVNKLEQAHEEWVERRAAMIAAESPSIEE